MVTRSEESSSTDTDDTDDTESDCKLFFGNVVGDFLGNAVEE